MVLLLLNHAGPKQNVLANLYFPWRSHHMEKLMEIPSTGGHSSQSRNTYRCQERQTPQITGTKWVWTIACLCSEGAASLDAQGVKTKFCLTWLFQLPGKAWNSSFTCSHTLIKTCRMMKTTIFHQGHWTGQNFEEYSLSPSLPVSSQTKAFKTPKLGCSRNTSLSSF